MSPTSHPCGSQIQGPVSWAGREGCPGSPGTGDSAWRGAGRYAGGVLHGEPSSELCPCVPRARTGLVLDWAEASGWYYLWHRHRRTPSARQSLQAREEWAAGHLPWQPRRRRLFSCL